MADILESTGGLGEKIDRAIKASNIACGGNHLAMILSSDMLPSLNGKISISSEALSCAGVDIDYQIGEYTTVDGSVTISLVASDKVRNNDITIIETPSTDKPVKYTHNKYSREFIESINTGIERVTGKTPPVIALD